MEKENIKNYKTIFEFMSSPENKMQRFIDAQNKAAGIATVFQQAVDEMKKGQKKSHWMWFIFPQLRSLGKSDASYFYGLDNLADADRFLDNDQTNIELRMRICRCFDVLLDLKTSDPVSVFGHTDAKKLFSCATLFSHTRHGFPEYKTACDSAGKVLQKFFGGKEDGRTLKLMNYVNSNELAVYLRALGDLSDDFSRQAFSERFPNICVPIESAKEKLFDSEECYIKKAVDLCNKNGIGYF